MRVERVVLEHHCDVALPRRQVVDDAVTDRDGAVGDLLEPRDHAQRRRLPAARRADEDEELTVLNLQRQTEHGLDAVVVDLVDIAELNVSHYVILQMWNDGPSAGNTASAPSISASSP